MATAQHVPVQFAVPAEFDHQLREAAELLEAGADCMTMAQSVLTGLGTAGIDSGHKVVVYFIFAKALKTAHAVQILCRTGFGSDGLSLCAVLFENLVDLLYIGNAPKRRPRRYFQFENVEKYFQARKVLTYKRLPKGRRRIYRGYEASLLPQVRNLLKYFPNQNGGWSQKSLYKRAKEIKAGLAYQELYWIFCGHKHTLPMSAAATTESTAAGDTLAITGPHMKAVCDAAEQSASILLQICSAVDRVFALSLRSEINSSLSTLLSAAAKVRQEHPALFS